MSGMSSYQAILLGAQAAGMGANLYAAYNQKKMTQYGLEIEKGEIGLRKQQEELSFAEANLASLQELQEVMATQRAILGARGQNPGVGSALAAANKSVRAQGADETARRLSKDFRQAQLDSMNRLLNIKKAGARSQYGASLIETGLSSFNLNTTIGDFINKGAKTKKTNQIGKNLGKNSGLQFGGFELQRGLNG